MPTIVLTSRFLFGPNPEGETSDRMFFASLETPAEKIAVGLEEFSATPGQPNGEGALVAWAAMERALQRVQPSALPSLLTRLARLDALSKGIGRGNVWDALRELALALAGHSLPAAA